MWSSDVLYFAKNVRGFGEFLKTAWKGEGYNVSYAVNCGRLWSGKLANHRCP
jgi:hypothetical protein